MPDIQTAFANALQHGSPSSLQAILNEWDDEPNGTAAAPASLSTITTDPLMNTFAETSISRATFDFVLVNPHVPMKHAVETLAKNRGFKPNTVSSLLAQMVRQGLISRDAADGSLKALVHTYRPLQAKAAKRKTLREKEDRSSGKAGISALAVSVPVQTHTTHATPMTAKYVLDNLGIREAHVLYRELQTMFG